MTEEQKGLLDKARRALQSARLLFVDGDFDGAASRAYYVMFEVAEALLLSRGLAFSSHSAVISAFGREFANSGDVPRECHRHFIGAQEARNIGDYEATSHVAGEEARLHIEHAEELLRVGGRADRRRLSDDVRRASRGARGTVAGAGLQKIGCIWRDLRGGQFWPPRAFQPAFIDLLIRPVATFERLS